MHNPNHHLMVHNSQVCNLDWCFQGVLSIENLRSLCSHALDLVRCMHLSLRLSKSNTMKNNDFKNHYRIKIYRFETHTFDLDILISKSIHWRTCLEKLKSLFPQVVAHLHMPCDSHACRLYASRALYPTSKEVLYTQDLPPNDSNHYLGTPKCGLWNGGDYNSLYFSLFGGRRQLSPKVIRKP